MATLLKFLEGTGEDHTGRTHQFILEQADTFWESHHDFIQWMFPLNEKSRAVPTSPVLQAAEIEIIKDSQRAQVALQRATKRFKRFLHHSFDWRYYSDHNHLRITRVIKSLRLTASDESANRFRCWIYDELDDDLNRIDPKTLLFWQDA